MRKRQLDPHETMAGILCLIKDDEARICTREVIAATPIERRVTVIGALCLLAVGYHLSVWRYVVAHPSPSFPAEDLKVIEGQLYEAFMGALGISKADADLLIHPRHH